MPQYFTKEGLDLKHREIRIQEEKVRSIGKEAGEEAGPSCDWHDNFGYEDAKRRLELESAALKRLREEVNGAIVISVHEQQERVMIGVTVRFTVDSEPKEFTIGAYGETDPPDGLISYTSPLARALLGMSVGDSKTCSIAGNDVELEVTEILPPSHRYRNLLEGMLTTGVREA
jgi:transcription elongation GreA/GreB family factor